jgi:hypothetical protein
VNVRHYHVTERVGQTERVVLATFPSAFQAGRDMALRQRASHVVVHDRRDEPLVAFGSGDDARRELPPRAVISYEACCCTVDTGPVRA